MVVVVVKWESAVFVYMFECAIDKSTGETVKLQNLLYAWLVRFRLGRMH